MDNGLNALYRELSYQEVFLAHLNLRLASPTPEWPTVRYWTEPNLGRLFKQVRDRLVSEGVESRLTHSSLLEWLGHLHLAASLPIKGAAIFLLEIGASDDTTIDHLELMMAGKPSGVVCYFSAVAFHGLTTQLVEHEHVAELQSPSSGVERERPEVDVAERARSSLSRRPRTLGKLLFRYEGVPFYSTRRSTRLIPGIQMWGHGPRALIRITTLEQTLLDTLFKPFHCGGPEVVFEAWQQAVASRRIDEERLATYLRSMNYPATARRVGVMLELAGGTPGAELRRFLESCRESVDRRSRYAQISLLPGVEYRNLNESWLVNTP